MKRDSRGRFAQTWSQETKRSHRLSLTSEAWQLLEQRASELGISRSEVVEQYARSLQNIDEQKRLEGSLQEELEKYQKQQARLEAVLNFLPIPLMLVELETGLFPFSNRAATEMAGQPVPDDMPAGTYNTDYYCTDANGEMVAPEQLPALRIARGERIEGEELNWHTPSGDFPLLVHADILPSAEGFPPTGVIVFQSIAERKKLELELQRREQEFRTLAENAPDIIYRLDRNSRHIYVSPSITKTTGMLPEALIGKTVAELGFPETTVAYWQERIQQVLETGKEAISEFEWTTPEGTLYLQSRLVPEFGANGIESILGVTRNVTNYKKIEQALRDTEARLNLALAAARMVAWDWDIQTGQAICSENATQFWGIDRGTGSEFLERIHPEDQAIVFQHYARAIEQGEPFQVEYRIVKPDGQICWLSSQGTVCYGADGQPERLIGVAADISDRKQAEVALKASETFYRTLGEAVPNFIWSCDATGKADFVNYRWIEYTGLTLEELNAGGLEQINHPDDYPALMQQWEAAAQKGEPLEAEFRYRRHDGEYRWFLGRAVPLKDATGSIQRWIGTTTDIHERKQIEAEREQVLAREQATRILAEKVQQQLRVIFETSPIGIGFLDQEQRFVEINAALAEIHGLTPEQHLGQSIADLFGQSDPELVRLFAHLYETGEPFVAPQLPVHVPGRDDRHPGYYNVHYLPLLSKTQQVESVLVYVIDVTDKVRSEQAQSFLSEASAILNSSLDYQTTLEQVARLVVPELADWCTVHMLEAGGTVKQLAVAHVDPAKVKWAKQLAEKYPVDRTAIRGAGLTLRTGESDLIPEITDEMLVAGAKDPEQLEIYRQVGFKSVMTVALSAQSKILGVISFIAAESGRSYDQTDLRMAEELARRASLAIENARAYRSAQQAQAQAESANRVKDEFLAVLSHELRSPLNPILGWTKMLQTRQFDESARKRALETIERNAKVQGRLIEDLLDVSRILNGKMSLNVCSVNLRNIIQAALETVRLSAEVKSIQIVTTLNIDIGQVMGDESRLQQVVWNLLSNAVKFTPSGGTITVELLQNGAFAQIQVRDTGKGINPNFLPHVFDYFRQADSTTTRQVGGLGLGLAIVRHLVELHGGNVKAESAGEGMGATFTVALPVVPTTAEPADDRSPIATTNDLSNIRILVVDDDEDMRDLMQILLSEYEAQVFAAASALEALQLFSELAPDILISDIGMPEMDGYSLIEQIRSFPPERGGQILAIALTAYAGEYNQQKVIAAGFNHHLSKPIEPEHLIQTISKLLGIEQRYTQKSAR